VRLIWALALTALAFAAAPAIASSSGSSHAKKTEEGSAFATPRVPTISMPTLVAPVGINGELDHYVYLGIALELTSDEHKSMMLDKIPYLQDAFLREVHGATLARDGDPSILDEVGLKARLLAASEKVVGPGIVKAVAIYNATLAIH
jgi:flagellar basal body-associated protein FliL